MTLLSWIWLIPVVLASLVAPAVMPARAADGTVRVVLCTGTGPVTATVTLPSDDGPSDDGRGGGGPGEGSDAAHPTCAWHVLRDIVALAGGDDAAATPVARVAARAVILPAARPVPGRARTTLPPARASPTLS